jgi:trans-2-enoyl-CoA reductase
MATSQEVSNLAIYKVRGDQNAKQEWTQHVRVANGFAPEHYDTINMGYTGDNLTTVVYKLDGVTVATLTLGYTGDNLTQIVRS